MKKSLVIILLLLLASARSYPQIKNSGAVSKNSFALLAQKLADPVQRKALNESFSKQLEKGRLNKQNGDPELYLSVYRPHRVNVDTTQRITYSYDFPGHLISRLYEILDNGQWGASIIDSMTYDAKGNMLSYISRTYSNSTVTSTMKVYYTYNPDGKLLTVTMETIMDFYVIPGTRITFTYDANGNVATMLMESASFSGWINISRDTYTYDTKGNILTNISEVWDNNSWRNSMKETYTYDGNGDMLTSLWESWNGSAWENFNHVTNTYINRNLITSLEEEWLNNAWTSKSRLTNTFDNNGYFISDLKEQWMGNVWVNLNKHVYTNDAEGNALKGESFEWEASGKWVPVAGAMEFRYNGYSGKKEILPVSGSVVIIEYETIISGVENTPVTAREYGLAQNYPNPFNPSTTISYSLKKEGNVKLTVFDALGKTAAVIVDEFKPAGSYSVKFDGSSLPSGIYIYRLDAGEFTAAKKFILMK